MRVSAWKLLVPCIAVGLGCGVQSGDPGPRPVNHETVKLSVGAEGGTLTHPTGAALVVPAGALAGPVELTVTGIDAPSQLPGQSAGQGFRLGPDGTQFLRPVEVVVPFDPALLRDRKIDAATLKVFLAPGDSADFAELETQVDVADERLLAKTLHFSQVAPAAPDESNPVSITTPSPLPKGVRGEAYDPVTFAASGGTPPYEWRGMNDFPGVSLSAGGVLSGTPSLAGSFSLAVRVKDSEGRTVERAFALEVEASDDGSNPAPTLTKADPLPVKTSSFPLRIFGTGFIAATEAWLNGEQLEITYRETGMLLATIPAAILAAPGTHDLWVVNPAPGGGESNHLVFEVVAAPNPAPSLAALTPDAATAGAGDLVVTLAGNGFVATSQVWAGDTRLDAVFESANALKATLPAALLAAAGTLELTVLNPPPGGGESAPLSFVVELAAAPGSAPTPALLSVTPSRIALGSGDIEVMLYGKGFEPDSLVTFDDAPVPVRWERSSYVHVKLPASALTAAGAFPITVANPNGAQTDDQTLLLEVEEVENAVPVVTSVSPGTVDLSAGGATVTVTGSNFPSRGAVYIGGHSVTVTGTTTELTLTLNAMQLPLSGVLPLVVQGVDSMSEPWHFTVAGTNPAPDSLAPNLASVGAGTSDILISFSGDGIPKHTAVTVTSSNGESWNQGNCGMFSYTCRVWFTARQLSRAGTLTVTLTNPAPGGGGASTQIEVLAGAPTPQLAYSFPTTLRQGLGEQELVFSGSFTADTKIVETTSGTSFQAVSWSATSLTINVPAALTAETGTLSFVAQNPGGRDSLPWSVPVEIGPIITSISPSTVSAGGGDFVLTITGTSLLTGWSATAVDVTVNDQFNAYSQNRIKPTSATETEMQVTVPARMIESPGSFPVNVHVPKASSNAVILTVE